MLVDVVVAWDGSGRARSALDWAMRRRTTRSIHLVRVLTDDESGHDIAAGCRIALDAEVARHRGAAPEMTAEVVHGDVEAELLARARSGSVLVLGTGGVGSRLLPHRSEMLGRIARLADGPVALVPVTGGDPTGPVIAGVDGTAAGVAAAQIAAAEAAANETSVVTVRVHGGTGVPDGWPGGPLDECARELTAHFPHLLVRQRTVRGDVRRELLQAAVTASLLVIGRHDVPGPGVEIEDAALRGASCPVLLVRDQDALWTADSGPALTRAALR